MIKESEIVFYDKIKGQMRDDKKELADGLL